MNKRMLFGLLLCMVLISVFFLRESIRVKANDPEPDGWDADFKNWYGDNLHQSGDFQYLLLINTDRILIMGYIGSDENLVIPNEIDGHIVEGVYNLRRKVPIKSITLGENFGEYEAIGKQSGSSLFNNISELETIKVSKNNKYYTTLKGILYSKDKTILYNCPSGIKKTKVTIPASVEYIHEAAYNYNKTIKKIVFSKKTKVRNLNLNFSHMENLESVSFNTKIRSIDSCFIECPRLKKIRFKKGLKKINDNSFQFLDMLENVTLPSTLEEIGECVFMGCPKLNSVCIPKTVRYIGTCSFEKEGSERDIQIPSYLVDGISQDRGAYYAVVSVDGIERDLIGIKKISVVKPFGSIKMGEKKGIELSCIYEEWTLYDEREFTGNKIYGDIDKDCIESGIFAFSSDNPEIISVSSTGELNAISKGTARITIMLVPKKEMKISFVMTVL